MIKFSVHDLKLISSNDAEPEEISEVVHAFARLVQEEVYPLLNTVVLPAVESGESKGRCLCPDITLKFLKDSAFLDALSILLARKILNANAPDEIKTLFKDKLKLHLSYVLVAIILGISEYMNGQERLEDLKDVIELNTQEKIGIGDAMRRAHEKGHLDG